MVYFDLGFVIGSSDNSIPEGDGSNGSNRMPENNKSDDTTTHKSHHKISDWRDFRAHLVAREQVTNCVNFFFYLQNY